MSKIVYSPYRRPRTPRKKAAPEITPARIVTAYTPQRFTRNRLYGHAVAARSDGQPEPR